MARNTPRGAKWKFVHNAFILRFAVKCIITG
ncbi:unknown [Prevotella sp. CAG:1124]|nr:unknown [Prevotella sp. CAG:1124]